MTGGTLGVCGGGGSGTTGSGTRVRPLNGALIVADLGRELRIFEGEIEIGGPGDHLLEQRFAARFDFGGTEALHGDRGVALGNSRRSLDHGETGNRQGRPPISSTPSSQDRSAFPRGYAG